MTNRKIPPSTAATAEGHETNGRSGPERTPTQAPAPEPPDPDVPTADPEVAAKARRRQFSAQFKLRVLAEADACTEPGAVGRLLRREGLYSSHLVEWRRARDAGVLEALAPRRRGPKARARDARDRRIVELERENRRLQDRLSKAETIIEVQGKVSRLLGLPEPPATEMTGRKS